MPEARIAAHVFRLASGHVHLTQQVLQRYVVLDHCRLQDVLDCSLVRVLEHQVQRRVAHAVLQSQDGLIRNATGSIVCLGMTALLQSRTFRCLRRGIPEKSEEGWIADEVPDDGQVVLLHGEMNDER